MADSATTTEDPDVAALRDLVQSRGWQLLKARAAQDFGPEGYGRAMQRAIAAVPQGPDRPYELARVAEQVEHTAQAVNTIMSWPEQQIRALAEKPKDRRPFANLRRA
jgi:hypothetical protein